MIRVKKLFSVILLFTLMSCGSYHTGVIYDSSFYIHENRINPYDRAYVYPYYNRSYRNQQRYIPYCSPPRNRVNNNTKIKPKRQQRTTSTQSRRSSNTRRKSTRKN